LKAPIYGQSKKKLKKYAIIFAYMVLMSYLCIVQLIINKLKLSIMSNINERVQEILVANGLDFRIHKLPMGGMFGMVVGDEGKLVAGPDYRLIPSEYYGLFNDKTGEIINTVKGSYHVSQNDEIVELVLRGIEGFGELSVQKAGALDGGKKVFIQLAVEGLTKLNDGDTIKRYVTIIDSNDGSTSLSVGTGDLTMSCQNQFFKFHKNSQARFKHSASLEQKMLEIPMLIQNALSQSMKMVELYNSFQSNKVSRELAHAMVNHLLGFDKKTTAVRELSEKSSRSINAMEALYANIEHQMNEKGNNLWGLHSGVTRWTTHEKSAPRRDNGRFESQTVGTNYRTNQDSLAFAMDKLGLVMA
jgi:hypothetical protein